MKISDLMSRLDKVWKENGDLDVLIVYSFYTRGGGPGLSDTGGGWSSRTIAPRFVEVSEEYPTQVELRAGR